MMRRLRSDFLRFIAISLAVPLALHAQGHCPQGQYQALPSGTPGPGRCVPVPRNLQGVRLDLPQPATHWGAIAADEVRGNFGAARDLPNRLAATEQAMTRCRQTGGTHCEVATAFGNGCGVLVAGEKGWQGFADVTVRHAQQTGITVCRKNGNQHCRVIYSDCSPGQ
ncbi:DUF4189 domain-containing protein [Dyella lutea]|uniref:DUF4189 domain-containing protein n=1 Tax=Dyella lutea TaxID=2950441 RepID=UPI003CCD2E33